MRAVTLCRILSADRDDSEIVIRFRGRARVLGCYDEIHKYQDWCNYGDLFMLSLPRISGSSDIQPEMMWMMTILVSLLIMSCSSKLLIAHFELILKYTDEYLK